MEEIRNNQSMMNIETIINDLNILISSNSDLRIRLTLNEINFIFNILITNNSKIQRYIRIYAKSFSKMNHPKSKQSSTLDIKYIIYGLLFILIRVNTIKKSRLKKIKHYYQALLTLYHNQIICNENLTAITQVMIIIDKHYDYNFDLVNIIIQSITTTTIHPLLPCSLFQSFISSFDDPSCEYYLNKQFLLLLSIDNNDIKPIVFDFLLKAFKYKYDLSFTSFLVKHILKANVSFKTNSIHFIKQLIEEEETSRLTSEFFIKKGFVVQNNNPIIINPLINLSNEYTIIFSFRLNAVSSRNTLDKSTLFEAKSSDLGKNNILNEKTLIEIFILNQKLYFNKNQRSSYCTELLIDTNKDYLIIITQKKNVYLTINGYETSFNHSFPSLSKEVTFILGQNFEGVFGTLIFMNKSYQSKSNPEFSNHIMNLKEDYDLLFKIDNDLTCLKNYSNHVVSKNKKYFEAYQYLKNKKINVDFVLSPDYANRFIKNSSLFRISNNIKVRLEDSKSSFVVRSFNQYTIFQFLQYEGLKYVELLFGLLSKESNDDVNTFIGKVLSLLFKLIDALGEKYFKNQLNVLFTLILNYLASNDRVKVNRNLFKSLCDKINCFNLTDEIKIRNCLVKLLLIKNIYWESITQENAISLLSCVFSCIQCNSTGLIKKTIVNQLLTFTYIIEQRDSSVKHYKKLIKELAVLSLKNNKSKIFDPLITYIITKGDISEMLHYKLLKIVYLYFGNEDIVKNNNEFVCYLVSQIESKIPINHCKWCSLSKSICFLIIVDYINKANEFRKKFIFQIHRLCSHYVSMQFPSKEFFRCVLVQFFKLTTPSNKIAYIKGKVSFKNILCTSNENDITNKQLSILKNKLKSFEKYIEIVYERNNNQSMTKSKDDCVLELFNSIIMDMLDAMTQNSDKNLIKIIQAIYSSNSLLNYMLFLFKKSNNNPDVFLIDIIKKTLGSILNPFYFNFLVLYYENDVDREDDPQINNVVMTLTQLLSSNPNTFSDSKNFLNNQHMFIISLYQIISIGQLIVSKTLEKCTLDFLLYFSKQITNLSLKKFFNIGNKLKNLIELVIEILVMLYKYNNYSKKYVDIFNNLILHSKENSNETIFYLFDYDRNIRYTSANSQNNSNDYSFCIFFLMKFIRILYEEKENESAFDFIKQMSILTANNALLIYNKFKTKLPFKSTYINDHEYVDLASYIELKFMDRNFDNLINHFFDIFNQRKLFTSLQQKKSTKSVKSKNLSSMESSLQNEMIMMRSSNPFKQFQNFVFEIPNEVDINTTCETFPTKKRSLSQKCSKIKNNLLNKSSINQENGFTSNLFHQRHLFFIDDNEKESIKFLFNMKHNLIWNTFPFMLKDYIFTNKTFVSMKKCFNELYPNKKENNALKELAYPTKVKNYISKSYYKPFLKPDINFFTNPLLSISHDYYSKAKDNTMTQFSFGKIIPRIEKILFQSKCELFTNLGTIFCELILSPHFILIVGCSDKDYRFKMDVPVETKMQFVYSSDENDINTQTKKQILFYIDDIEEIIPRRCYFQWIGLEFFLSNRQSFCLNLFSEESKNRLVNELSNLINSSPTLIVTNIEKEFKKKDYTKLWLEDKISNFNYLLLLNKYSSRTYHDIYQYPIFPWIICDMEGTAREMANVICDQPIKTKDSSQGNITKDNIYTFHYSNGGHILYYLVRLNPFTYTHIKFQSFKFDSASRIFNSIKDTLSIFNLLRETRELTPEFFFDTNFLINLNKNSFGFSKNRNLSINDVNADERASKTNIQFVLEQRTAIDQQEELYQWINNIFGFYQMKIGGRPGQFKKISYEKKHEFDSKIEKWKNKGMNMNDIYAKLRAHLSMLAFGMTPYQLFTKSHPKKTNPPLIAFNGNHEYNYNSVRQYLSSNKKGDNYRVGIRNNRIYFKSLSSLDLFEINSKDMKKDSVLKQITFERQGHLRFRLSSFCEISNGIFAFCRFFDNTIKIMNLDNNIHLSIQCFSFITAICSIGDNEFLTGDEYGYITRWILRNKDIHSDFSFVASNKVLGHETGVLKIIYEQRHDIIISIDELNICVIHNATTLDLLNIIEINEKIQEVKLSYHDILFFLCEGKEKSQRFNCYTLNGLLISQSKPVSNVSSFELSNNSCEIFVAHSTQVYKANFFEFDLSLKDEDHPSYLYSEENKVIKEMIYVWEMKMVVFVFVNNTITFKMFE